MIWNDLRLKYIFVLTKIWMVPKCDVVSLMIRVTSSSTVRSPAIQSTWNMKQYFLIYVELCLPYFVITTQIYEWYNHHFGTSETFVFKLHSKWYDNTRGPAFNPLSLDRICRLCCIETLVHAVKKCTVVCSAPTYYLIITNVCSQFMMTSSNGNIFRVTGPLCEEFTGHRWIPHTKVSDAELWCFLSSASE